MRWMKAVMAGAVFSALFAGTAFAGEWVKGDGANQDRWRYDNQDGTFANSGWFWIDGNGDGIAESYCFDGEGWLYVNTTTPDGYVVNENGAWVSEGQVMTQQAEAPAQTPAPTGDSSIASVAGTYSFYGARIVDTGVTNTDLRKITLNDGRVVNQNYPGSVEVTVVDENTIRLYFSQDEMFLQPDIYTLKKNGDVFVFDSYGEKRDALYQVMVCNAHFEGDTIEIGRLSRTTGEVGLYLIYKR